MASRINNYFKKRRERLMAEDPHCCYCGIEVIYYPLKKGETPPDNFATIEHFDSRWSPKRPLNHNAYGHRKTLGLACFKCNGDKNRAEMEALPIERIQERSKSFPFAKEHKIKYLIFKLLNLPLKYYKKKELRRMKWKQRQLAILTNWLLRT